MTFVSAMALASSSFFMSVTGGGLQPHEVRAIEAAMLGLVGNEAAAAELERATPYIGRTSVHLVPLQPIELPDELRHEAANDLLGGSEDASLAAADASFAA